MIRASAARHRSSVPCSSAEGAGDRRGLTAVAARDSHPLSPAAAVAPAARRAHFCRTCSNWRLSKLTARPTIEADKRADALILNRNPLDNMSSTTDIYRVIQSGTVMDREALTKCQESVPGRAPGVRDSSPQERIGTERGGRESMVLLNDRLITAKFDSQSRIRVSMPRVLLQKIGRVSTGCDAPGSGGGVSNTFY